MNLCSEHQPPRLEFKHHTISLQASLIDMSDATFLEFLHFFGSLYRDPYNILKMIY